MITYETETTIEASPEAVWKHLIAFDRHDEWSRHFKLRGEPSVGERGRVEFELFGKPTGAPVVIQRANPGRELRWNGGPKGIVFGSHYFIMEPLDGGSRTRFRHGESFSGVLAPLVWALLKAQLGPSYNGFNQDLKRRVEQDA